MSTPTRKGKIASLPHAIRTQLNQRLHDGYSGAEILPWLNALPEVKARLAERWGGVPIDDGNLSEWRLGGYRDWLAEQRRVERLRSLSELSADIARATGGNLSEGSVAILGGKILEQLEALDAMCALDEQTAAVDEEEADGKARAAARRKSQLEILTALVTDLRAAEIAANRLRLDQEKQEHKRQELALSREKFETQTVEKFLQWARRPEAQAIIDSGKSQSQQIAELRQLFFQREP